MSFCTLKSGVVICGLDSGVLIHTLNSLLVSPGRKRVKHNLDNGCPLEVHTFGKIMVSMQQSEKLITPSCHICYFYFYSIKYRKLTSMC